MMLRNMPNDAHARANAEQLRFLLDDLELAAALTHPVSTAARCPADFTPTEIVVQLARMHAADHGQSDDLPSAEERTALADYLGCHEDVRTDAWTTWSAELNPTDWDAAEYWLDVEFTEPCPEMRPA